MEIKPRKNEYGHEVVDCPFCSHWVYLRDITKVSPDPLRDLKRHITSAAKNEAMELALTPILSTTDTPHLTYYKEHTKTTPAKVSVKRQYDTDLRI